MIGGLFLAAFLTLPKTIYGLSTNERSYLSAWVCTLCGLISGCLIGFITEYYTSHARAPVRDLVE
jgi:inorganic pyrophosphatase